MTVLQILSTLSFLCFAQADFIISETVVARENASNICSLATPDIHYSAKGITVEVNKSYIKDGDKLWVGYVSEFDTFLYIGCFHLDGLLDNKTTEKDIGQCASFCKSPFIGMQINKCYCIDSQPTDTWSGKCTSQCDTPKKTLCGKDGEGVSVYMSVDDNTDSKPIDQNCQAVQKSSTSQGNTWNYEWKNCNNKYKTICQSESSKHFLVYNEKKKWRESMNICQEKDQQPSEIINGSIENMDPGEFGWTGKIQSLVIKKTGDLPLLNQPMVQQGYIERDKQHIYLRLKPTEETLCALCIGGSTTHQQTSTKSTTEENSKDDTMAKKKEDESPNLIAVYVVIPLLIVITLVVIVVLLWRKRKHNVVKKDDPSLSQESDHINQSSINALSNESYQDGDVGHDYFTLEPVNEYAEIKDVEVTAAADDEYDTTTNLPKKANVTSNDTGNVYNKLEKLADDTYNHTNTTTATVEKTYNKATSNDQESAYNTADALPGSGIANDKVTDGEYNTLDSSAET